MNHDSYSATLNIYSSPNSGIPNSTTKALHGVKKRAYRELQPITPEILKALLDTVTDLRDRALLLVLIESGLRPGEITCLDRSTIQVVIQTLSDGSDVSLGTGKLLLSKQGLRRSFWVGQDSVAAVVQYLTKERADDDEAALFVTKYGKRIPTSAIDAAVNRWCKSAGIEPIRCFRFRHTLGLTLACALVSYSQMAKLLGYSNPQSIMQHFTESSDHPSPGIYRRLLGFVK